MRNAPRWARPAWPSRVGNIVPGLNGWASRWSTSASVVRRFIGRRSRRGSRWAILPLVWSSPSGGLALAPVSVGGIAIGLISWGGAAVGLFVMGGFALGGW